MEWNFSKSPVNDSDFRWNWAKANVDPSYKPQGPGIGSLLMSLNPNTQQQGLQQINADMARDAAARDAVLKQGAAENQIINELYNQDMDMKKLLDSQEKTKGAKEGHKNSWIANYSKAVADGDGRTMKLLENEAVGLFGNNALEIINQGKIAADEAKEQNYNYDKIMESLPSTDRKFDNPEQRGAAIAIVDEAEKNKKITREQATKARTHINSIPDWATINLNMSKQAHSQNRVNKSVVKENVNEKNSWVEKYMKEHNVPKYEAEKRWEQSHKE